MRSDTRPALNAAQQQAIRLTDRPLLVLAGAGSGKTRVITEKIAYLIRQGIGARHIAALTFTNKAACEMKQRVAQLLPGSDSRGLRVATFHALGLEILRKEHAALGYKSALSLFDEQDRLALVRSLVRHDAKTYDENHIEHYAVQIGQWKNACVLPNLEPVQRAMPTLAFVSAFNTPEAQYAAWRLFHDYARQLKAYNAVDFDDLILLPVRLWQQHPAILEKWQQRIRYLLVDEYQDTNLTQYQWIKLLAGPLGRFTVVGDDDQSIYAWRGAHPENLAQLPKDFPRLAVIKLEQNYRSMRRILKAANHLIAHNPHLFEKKLWSQLGEGDKLRVLAHRDEAAEARQIVAEIIHHKYRHAGHYGDYAILYRGNHQARVFERALRENSVPYFLSGGTSFFARQEIKDIMAYLRLIINAGDDAAFLRIINTPRREIGPATLETLGAYANARHLSLFDACQEFGLKQRLPERAAQRLEHFCALIRDVADRAQRGDTFAVLRDFIDQLDYAAWLREHASSDAQAQRRMQNVNDLLDWLARMREPEDGGTLSLAEIVAKAQLLDILDRQQEDAAGDDRVSLMTLHAAKGLEFPHVFLVGCEEGLLPHQTSIDSGAIEEERRLAYVGITRAQQSCTLSYCTHRTRYGDKVECQPSRFLLELPESELEWPARQALAPEEQKARGRASLAQLRQLLGDPV